jgi:dihydrofolate reductase
MSKVVLDVSMSLDGFSAGPNVREAEPMGGTHRTREDLLGDNGGTFAFDGLEATARRAKVAAGDKDVVVLGAEVARHLLRAGLLDEVRIHLVPLLMGEFTRLFARDQAELIPEGKPVAGAVTHLGYRVSKR